MTSIDYNKKTLTELVSCCKERNIRGYAANGRTKATIIKLLNEYDLKALSNTENYDTLKYDELLELCRERKIKGYLGKSSTGTPIITKDTMIQALKDNITKISLYEYLIDYNSLILARFVGNINDLKKILPGTNNYYMWKCDTSKCVNTFRAIPRIMYTNNLPRKYCDICTHQNRKVNTQITILKRSGSIKTKFSFIEDIWSTKNKKTPNDFSPGSNEKVYLKCPNNIAKHPDYEIDVCKIQEHNCYRCPKCITKTSNAEMRIYSELKCNFKDVKWQQKIEGREADIIIEDLKLVIEVDGYPWHKGKNEKDLEKNVIFEKKGYNILRIRDSRLDTISCNNIICDIVNIHIKDYNRIIDWINIKFKYNINKYDEWKNSEYYKEIQVSKMSIKYEESIEYIFPESKDLWDYKQNYPFLPSQISKGSDMEIWLKCSNNHSWKRKLSHLFRIIKDKKHIMKCPECHKLKSNKTKIEINGIYYNSISECCRTLNIDRNILYKVKGINIQKQIEDILKSSIIKA